MNDPRMHKLAKMLITYSCGMKRGDKVLVEAYDAPNEFVTALVYAAKEAGGQAFVSLKSNAVNRALMLCGDDKSWKQVADVERKMMASVQCYLGVRGNPNVSELSDVPDAAQKAYEKQVWRRVHQQIRVNKTRWCVLRWPNASMAQLAKMSTEAFEDFYFNVCTLDYAKMSKAMMPLVKLMNATDKVRLKGPGDTDLTFSMKGIKAKPCDGHRNIPDGEVFSAPVKESVNGVIHYNAPSLYRGVVHTDVRLEFKDGKIVKATSSDTKKLNEVFDTDAGARYVGEFAIGFNPWVKKPMLDILFDEKIAGSIHFTPGQCYEETYNGNKSGIHWDLVLIQTPEYGGGEIVFDGKTIRKDGRFVIPELKGLNPEKLL